MVTRSEAPFEIVHVNDAWSRLCGFSQDQCEGKTLKMIQGELTNTDALQNLTDKVHAGNSGVTDLINYTSSGRKFRNRLEFYPVVAEDGETVVRFLGVLNDMGDVVDDDETQQVRFTLRLLAM